jgi:glycosyltransferase involved in cell wall biosynthesis
MSSQQESFPLVSVIIPCYNAESYVGDAIRSVLAQTYPNCEIIVVDDGSTDRSLEVVRGFEPSIKVIAGPNQGGCAARNKGLDAATGDYIQFLDADDMLSPDKIKNQIAVLANASANTAVFGEWHHFLNGSVIRKPYHPYYYQSFSPGVLLLEQIWGQNRSVLPHCWLCPRSLIQKVGRWNEELKADQDGEYFGRLLIHAERAEYVQDSEVYYRIENPNSVSKRNTKGSLHSRYQASKTICDLLSKQPLSDNMRIAMRRRWMTLARYRFARYDIKLAWMAIDMANQAKAPAQREPGGLIFRTLQSLFGLKGVFLFKRIWYKFRDSLRR